MMATIPKTPVPPILYKYCPPERIDIIEGLQVRFSRPSEFNDAFDSQHLLPATAEPKTKSGRISMRNRLGVLCLTERPDNHLMWVNYAKNHTGFLIGFDSSSEFFENDDRVLRKVIYQRTPPLFDTADERACFYKAPEWEYEQEWRCAKKFSPTDDRLVDIEPVMIRQIVFGSKMEPSSISRIMQYAMVNTLAPDFLQCSSRQTQWKLVNRPIVISMCPHCGGDGYVISKTQSAE